MNTIEHIYYSLNASGFTISDEIKLVMGNRKMEDIQMEHNESDQDIVIIRKSDSVENILKWLEDNKMIVPSQFLTKRDFEIAEQNGIRYSVAYDRVHRYNWDKQIAITKPVRKKAKNQTQTLSKTNSK